MLKVKNPNQSICKLFGPLGRKYYVVWISQVSIYIHHVSEYVEIEV